ncbi:UNVERIFIED_CONTAM: hypothetical protein GTU68_037318 [Idotea baltica]|nr:hypothetical protein [Idotea baltica]
MNDSPSTIAVHPLSPTIGAELSGFDLSVPQTDEQFGQIRQALLDWKVVFFRDQDLSHDQHLAFGRRFGELEVHPFADEHPDYPEVLQITHDAQSHGFENIWHSDVTWRLAPSLGSVLLMKEAPPVGGDTLFADMYAAYDGLSDDLKDEIDGALARHDFSGFRRGMIRRGATDAEVQAFNERYPNPHHPVVRTHPETGRRGLYVNRAFTQEIVGVSPERSDDLLQLLYAQASHPEYQCRFRWQKHSIAFWDNRACQHYAVSDYWPNNRSVERVTIVGDEPYFDAAQPVTGRAEPRPFRGTIDRQFR